MPQLSKELQEKAKAELNEDPSRLDEYTEQLREWLKKQPHLISRQDNHFLLCFLRGCKFSLQKVKEKLDSFYTIRSLLPEYFTLRDPFSSKIQLVLSSGGILPLPKTDGPAGCRIMMFRWSAMNPTTMPFTVIIQVMYLILDVLMEEDPNIIISGLHFIADMKNFPPAYTLQFTPNALHKCILGVQTAYPLRLKGLDYLNVPSFFDTLFSVIKPLLTEKLQSRTAIYKESRLTDLYSRIPQDILPKEYGGSNESIDEIRDVWKHKIESYQKWFEDDYKYYCEEERRPEDMTNTEALGIQGTFRKLNID